MRGLIEAAFSIFLACVLVLVGARFFALLFAANRDSEIVQRIYRHSDFWVKPFFGMLGFNNEAVNSTGGVFEPASLIALVAYFIGGMIVLALISGSVYGRLRHA